MQTLNPEVHFVFFVNTKSGNGDGKQFFNLASSELVIRYESNPTAHLYFIDLFSPPSRHQGLELVKTFLGKNFDFRVIVVGGDGTIPWVLGEVLNEGINLARITLGIIPIGTGNDFSRSLGWGSKTVVVSKDNYKDLSSLVKRWIKAPIGTYDMWDVIVETFPDGKIFDIKS